MTRDSNPDFRINVSDRFQNAVHSLTCQRQSCRRVSFKSVSKCVRNANSPKSAVAREQKSDLEFVSGSGSSPKVK